MVPDPEKKYFSVFFGGMHPFSRGSVHIRSSDPFAAPVIDPRILDNDIDVQTFLEALKFVRRIVATESFDGFFRGETAPGPGVQTDDELIEYIRNTVQTTFHPVGTASMLPREKNGVVDSDLKVYGTENLRVVSEVSF